MRVLVVPDKWKGTLTAPQAAHAIQQGWRQGRAEDVIELLPMADGGDGFGAVIGALLGAAPQHYGVRDAAGRECDAQWWFTDVGAGPGTGQRVASAVLEAAEVNGLRRAPSA